MLMRGRWKTGPVGALSVTVTLAAPATLAASAHAQDFYAGRQIVLIVGSSSGGGYDLLGRLMARHIVKHITGNPSMIVQNMPAAGSIAAANHIYRAAAKDGLVLGLMQRSILLAPLINPGGVQYETTKLNWLGSLNSETGVAFVNATSAHKTMKDLFERELIVGANSNADPELSPKIYNALIGTKFKVVTGYTGTPAIQLAMERDEVAGIADWSWSSVKNQKPDWLASKRIVPLMQGALQRDRELPDLPNAIEFVKNETDRRVMELYFTQKTVARPVVAPPGVPPERLAILRAAFAKLIADQEFLADAGRQKLEAGPITGEAVDKVISLIATATPEVIARFKGAIGADGSK
jgi:tripartite-type tricarboxylate transporter receptor subunit TctC